MTTLSPQKKIAKVLALMSYALVLVAVTTCQLGTRHEEMKIPPEVRARMADTDWVGSEWILWAWLLFLAAVVVRGLAFMVARLTLTRKNE